MLKTTTKKNCSSQEMERVCVSSLNRQVRGEGERVRWKSRALFCKPPPPLLNLRKAPSRGPQKRTNRADTYYLAPVESSLRGELSNAPLPEQLHCNSLSPALQTCQDAAPAIVIVIPPLRSLVRARRIAFKRPLEEAARGERGEGKVEERRTNGGIGRASCLQRASLGTLTPLSSWTRASFVQVCVCIYIYWTSSREQ